MQTWHIVDTFLARTLFDGVLLCLWELILSRTLGEKGQKITASTRYIYLFLFLIRFYFIIIIRSDI